MRLVGFSLPVFFDLGKKLLAAAGIVFVFGGFVISCPVPHAGIGDRSAADTRDGYEPEEPGELIDSERDRSGDDEDGGVDASARSMWEEEPLGRLVDFYDVPLARLFEALLEMEQNKDRLVRVLHYGDSHIAADSLTFPIRRTLQERFGDGGRGFVLLGKPWRSYFPRDVSIDARGKWEAERILIAADPMTLDGRYGLAGVAVDGTKRGTWASVGTSPDSEYGDRASLFEVFFMRQPKGGSFNVFVDGKRMGAARTGAKELGSGFYKIEVDEGPHKFEVRLKGDGRVRLFGAVLESDGPGLVYDTLGLNGAFFHTPQRWDADLLSAQVAHRNPDLIVTSYGCNEADARSLTPEVYTEYIKDTLARLLAGAPNAACLLLGPMDRKMIGAENGQITRLDWIIEVQRQTAEEIGCAFLDTREMQGGRGSLRRWIARGLAQPDGIHLTLRGYQELGTLIARQIINGYESYVDELRDPEDMETANGDAHDPLKGEQD